MASLTAAFYKTRLVVREVLRSARFSFPRWSIALLIASVLVATIGVLSVATWFTEELILLDPAGPRLQVQFLSLLGVVTFFGLIVVAVALTAVLFVSFARRLQAVNDSMYGLLHDLKTPLTSAYSHVETALLAKGRTTQEEERYLLEVGLKELNRTGLLLGELAELSRLEGSENQIQLERLSLADLLHDVVAKFMPLAVGHGVRLTLVELPGVPHVTGDVGALERVLGNLINNAIRHTRRGGYVELELNQDSSWAKIFVRDSGEGMSSRECKLIFERFYQGNNKGNRGSSGLGLAICRRLIDAHRGKIKASSVQGKGTIFEIRLPLI